MYYMKRTHNLLSDRHEMTLCVGRLLFPCYDIFFLHSLRHLYRYQRFRTHRKGFDILRWYKYSWCCVYAIYFLYCVFIMITYSIQKNRFDCVCLYKIDGFRQWIPLSYTKKTFNRDISYIYMVTAVISKN